MYDPKHSASERRLDNEFLRRMSFGEFSERSVPTMNRQPARQNGACSSCGDGHGAVPSCPHPMDPMMPSLAMVYVPKQEWRCTLAPHDALMHGSLFSELIKPFEGRSVVGKRH